MFMNILLSSSYTLESSAFSGIKMFSWELALGLPCFYGDFLFSMFIFSASSYSEDLF